MRAERSVVAAGHEGTPLVVRGSLPRTFLSMGLFAEASLVFAGAYLLEDALKRPLEAQQAAVISAGVLLSLATILLFYLVRPRRFAALAKKEEIRSEEPVPETPLTAYGESLQARRRAEQSLEEEEDLPGPM